MNLKNILKRAVSASLWVPKKLLLTPLEKPMNAALKAALVSTLKKVTRTLLAVAATALLAALPAMQDVFTQAAAKGNMVEQAVFGLIVAGLVGLSAFVERFVATTKNGKS